MFKEATKSRNDRFESQTSMEIKALSEVEKIWILYDLDYNGELDFTETKAYLKEMAYPYLSLSDDQLEEIFRSIDYDGSGTIDKMEMKLFVQKLMKEQKDLKFKGVSNSLQYKKGKTHQKEEKKEKLQ